MGDVAGFLTDVIDFLFNDMKLNGYFMAVMVLAVVFYLFFGVMRGGSND